MDGDGKPYAFAPGVDGCVDADELAQNIEQRTAAVAGVDGRVGLNQVGEHAVLGLNGAVQGGDHARGHSVGKAEGIADGDNGFAGHEVRRIGHAHGGKIFRSVQAQDGDIEIGLGAHHVGAETAAVEQTHGNGRGSVDYVGVGQNQTFSAVDNDARSHAFGTVGLVRHAEKSVEGRGGPSFDQSAGDVDHGRSHLADGFDYRCHTGAGGVKGESRAGREQPDGRQQQAEQKRDGDAHGVPRKKGIRDGNKVTPVQNDASGGFRREIGATEHRCPEPV